MNPWYQYPVTPLHVVIVVGITLCLFVLSRRWTRRHLECRRRSDELLACMEPLFSLPHLPPYVSPEPVNEQTIARRVDPMTGDRIILYERREGRTRWFDLTPPPLIDRLTNDFDQRMKDVLAPVIERETAKILDSCWAYRSVDDIRMWQTTKMKVGIPPVDWGRTSK